VRVVGGGVDVVRVVACVVVAGVLNVVVVPIMG
jgi:hypothetical protein